MRRTVQCYISYEPLEIWLVQHSPWHVRQYPRMLPILFGESKYRVNQGSPRGRLCREIFKLKRLEFACVLEGAVETYLIEREPGEMLQDQRRVDTFPRCT